MDHPDLANSPSYSTHNLGSLIPSSCPENHMNLSRIRLTAAALLTLQASSFAQTTDFVVVSKLQLHEQTSATQVSLIPFLPFGCDLSVEDLPTLTPAPSVTGPISVSEPTHNGGVLGYNTSIGEWGYGFPNFNNYGTQTKAELDSLFGSGVYTFSVNGVSVPLNLTGEVYPSSAPTMTLTGGYWDSGKYYVEVGQTLTITTSAYLEFGTNAEDVVWIELLGCDYSDEMFSFAGGGGSNSVSLTIPPYTLSSGLQYKAETAFVAASDFLASIPGLPGAAGAATYDKSTILDIVVVLDGGLLGTNFCGPAVPNSSGSPAGIQAGGSNVVANNNVTLVATQLPPNQFGFFLVSQTQGFITNPGGAQGNLCLGGAIGRYSRPGEVLSSGPCGTFALALDLNDTPQPTGPVAILPGETWSFTAWFRDVNPTKTSNFTDGLSITFQ